MQSNGDIQGAHDAFVDYFERNEINYAALNLFGVCCMQLGKHEKAEALFRHITAEAPEIEDAFINLVKCYIASNDAEAALVAINNLKKFGNEKVGISILAAEAHHMNGDIQALKCLKDVKNPLVKRGQESCSDALNGEIMRPAKYIKYSLMTLKTSKHFLDRAKFILNRELGCCHCKHRHLSALSRNQRPGWECLSNSRKKFDDLLVSAKYL